jgi:hypothetical protein
LIGNNANAKQRTFNSGQQMSLWHNNQKDGNVVTSMNPWAVIAAIIGVIVLVGIACLTRA